MRRLIDLPGERTPILAARRKERAFSRAVSFHVSHAQAFA
jgi:hypothetical protein